MAQEVHVGDVGLQFEYQIMEVDPVNPDVTIPMDLRGATKIELLYERPKSLPLIVTPVFLNNGSDGLVKYITQPGDINIQGPWRVQVYIEIDGNSFYSEINSFTVFRNIRRD